MAINMPPKEKHKIGFEVSKEMLDLVKKVAQDLGFSMSDLARYSLKKELVRLGYLTETTPLKMVSNKPTKEV